MGESTTPTPHAPRKAIGNSGMFGRIIDITSPFFAPIRTNADPNLRESAEPNKKSNKIRV